MKFQYKGHEVEIVDGISPVTHEGGGNIFIDGQYRVSWQAPESAQSIATRLIDTEAKDG